MLPEPGSVRIYEVSPRDGLQNELCVLDVDAKVALIERLVAAGIRDIEATSFVRASWIPQLSDAAEVARRLSRRPGVRFWALVPNRVGLERALDAGFDCVATFMSASETHNRKNLNRTRRESLGAAREVIGVAQEEGVAVRSYISTAFGCPYEGNVDPSAVVEIAKELADAGAGEIAIGDTTGMANPSAVASLVGDVTRGGVPVERIGVHLHDTRGTALANALAAWQAGVRTFDGSIAGVGGCPYAPGAAGNCATEDLVWLFESMGASTGVDLDGAAEAGVWLAGALGRELPGRYHRYWQGVRTRAATRTA